MQIARCSRVKAVLAFVLSINGVTTALAQPPAPVAPAPAGNSFLQTFNKLRDATLNRRGNHPGNERTAQQKIEAIKYLATAGCACHCCVKEALLAALDDRTEEVRYEAAIALCKAAGDPCHRCDNSGCCNAQVMTKLHEIAYAKDAKCCPKESSPRVRAAAENASQVCRQKHPAGPVDQQEVPKVEQEEKKELPAPATKPVPAGDRPGDPFTEPTAPVPPENEPSTPAKPIPAKQPTLAPPPAAKPISGADNKTSVIVVPVTVEWGDIGSAMPVGNRISLITCPARQQQSTAQSDSLRREPQSP